jgi:hypothetical protein
MRHFAFAAPLLLLPACTAVDYIGTAADYVVTRYCDRAPALREGLRAEVASAIAPNRIVVECAGDQEQPS